MGEEQEEEEEERLMQANLQHLKHFIQYKQLLIFFYTNSTYGKKAAEITTLNHWMNAAYNSIFVKGKQIKTAEEKASS